MRAKKVIASFVIGALLSLFYISSVQAEYPLHPTANDKAYYGYGDTGLSASDSDAAASLRKFTVGGIEYLLLDQDENGNYFILQNNSVTNAAAYYSGGSSQTDESLDEWRYNYSDSKSIAYYLDNTYRNNMPESIKPHLIKYDWNIEGDWPRAADENSDWFKNKVANNPPEVQSGYVALMSATEFNAYKDIIGVANVPSTDWRGILLRTRFSNGANYSPLLSEYYKDNNGNISMGQSAINLTNYYLRPCFWVDANFFADVKVTGYENSSIVKQVLKEQGYAKLNRVGYTDEEILALGITDKNWYGLYPTHSTKNNKAYYGYGDTGLSASDSDAAASLRKFTVGGIEYLLLDQDENGNYFILQNNSVTNAAAYYSGGSSQTDESLDEWRYNYSDSKSIAYYLDNTYRNNMPESIKPHLIKYDWNIEGDWPRAADENSDWFKNKVANNPPEVQSGYVALMSATEFNAYKDIIGVANVPSTDWHGILLRTRFSLMSTKEPLLSEYFMNNKGNIEMGQSAIRLTNYYIRPCFWLDSEFFKTVHMDIDSLGEIVLKEMKNLGYENLVNLYTKEELEKIGYEPDKVPTAANVTVTMRAYENAIVGCSYTYDSVVDSPEKDSVIIWSAADSLNGEYMEIYRGTEKTIVIPNGYSGKNIKASVVPFDSDGRSGVRAEDCTPVQVTSAKGVYIGNAEIKDGSATLDIYNVGNDKKIINVYKTEYNSDGRLVGITADEYTIIGGESVKPVVSDIKDNYTYQIMVWEKDGDHPLFYMCK